ncbi:3875_t:CDS:10, partial [Entrophospora sp. SA101]
MGKVAAISESEKIVNDDESNANIENQKIPNKPVLEATSSNSPTTPPAIPPRTYPQQPSSTNSDVIVARRRPLWQQLIIVSMITELGKDTSEILSLKFSTSSTTSSLEPSLLTTLSTDLTSMAEKLKAHQEFENPKEEINEIQDSLGSLVTYLSSTINTPSGLMIDKDLDASQIKKEIRSIKEISSKDTEQFQDDQSQKNTTMDGLDLPKKTITEFGYKCGIGVFHSGVEILGREYNFGGSDDECTGIFELPPRVGPPNVTYSDYDKEEIINIIDELSEEWKGNTYQLLTRNCNHFTNELCLKLVGKAAPKQQDLALIFHNIIGTPNIYPNSSGKSSKVSLLLESTSTPRTSTTNLLPSDLTNSELSTTTTTNKRKNLEQFVSNTYEGNDRNVKNLLDSLYIKYFSEPMPEFGPSVTKAIVGKGSKGTGQIKTIASTLVAHITEHKASINQIRVSPDHNFVATCSDDGTVRIWDCGRFITFNCRSRITHIQKGKVKCMTFIDRTHSIASASDNGSIHIFRVECFTGSTPLKYGKAQIIRKTQLNGEVGEYAVAMEHYESGTDSILLYATSKGNICGLDLRTMEVVWTFTNPRSYGVITAMVLDKKFRWLLTGTSRGILTLWDLRFRIQLRSWTHPSKSRISRLLIHPQAMTGRAWVVVSAGKNEISIWDIEKIACKEAFGVITDEKMGGVTLDMFKALDPPESSDILRNAFTANEKSISVDHSVRAVLYPQECNFIITAGSDRKIRFWDNANIKDSYIIAGSDISESKPVYSAKQFDGIKFYYETQNLFRNSNSTSSHSSSSHSHSSSFSSGRNCITDLAITEFPHPMLISGDRDGILKPDSEPSEKYNNITIIELFRPPSSP